MRLRSDVAAWQQLGSTPSGKAIIFYPPLMVKGLYYRVTIDNLTKITALTNYSNCPQPIRCLCGERPRIYAFPCLWGNKERSGVLRGATNFVATWQSAGKHPYLQWRFREIPTAPNMHVYWIVFQKEINTNKVPRDDTNLIFHIKNNN